MVAVVEVVAVVELQLPVAVQGAWLQVVEPLVLAEILASLGWVWL